MAAASSMTLRFIGDVDGRLRPEVRAFARWIRTWYSFLHPFELRLIDQESLTADDGDPSLMRWWQSDTGRERVVVELAVGRFADDVGRDGFEVSTTWVLHDVGAALKTYFQSITSGCFRSDSARRWGASLVAAYRQGTAPPFAYRGVQEY